MESIPAILVLYAALWFTAGLWLGALLANIKWRSNADQPMRIESGGKLYKVYRDGEEPGPRGKEV